jgi:hypothetical protein
MQLRRAGHLLYRDVQLGQLYEALTNERAPLVCLHGARGSGRTMLARAFFDDADSHFPGGKQWFSAADRHPAISDEADLSYINQLNPHEAALIVFDDADAVPIDALAVEIREIRKQRPLAQVLITSVIPIHFGAESRTVATPPLTTEAILTLLRQKAPLPNEQLEQLAGRIQGNVLLAQLVSDRLAAGMPWRALLRLLDQAPFSAAVDPSGQPLSKEGTHQLEIAASAVSDELIAALVAEPELMYQLDPRRLEEVVAELYQRQGYDARLTPASGDGGADVYVVENNALGRSLTVIQVKRYAAHRKVGVGVVRELQGTLDIAGASTGMVLTTSLFTSGALDLEKKFRYRVSLRDYFAIQALLQNGVDT